MNKDDIIKKLQNKIKKLTDENESLWLMLDEIKESNIAHHQDRLKKTIEKNLKDLKQKRSKMPKIVGKA
tara:strand:- start:653 stop:859 length:207 start_codon:yes stop_codon:yes gene_type:complete